MAATEAVEGTVVEELAEQARPQAELVAHAGNTLAVAPNVEAAELVGRLKVIEDAMRLAMRPGVDYGRIPGVQKPTLLKPGAEKLGVLFQLDIEYTLTKTWAPDGVHLTVEAKAVAYHAPTGTRLGAGEGLCSTREKKYAKRRADLICPQCAKPNIRKSRNSPEYYCWQRTDGCGATFDLADQRITGQVVGEIDNPDLPDTWNTVVKIAKKRAQVDAVLAVTGASALFTQDLEETDSGAAMGSTPAGAPEVPTARPPRPTVRSASVAQRKLIFQCARDKGMNDDQIRELLVRVAGTPHSDRVAADDVDAVLSAIKEG